MMLRVLNRILIALLLVTPFAHVHAQNILLTPVSISSANAQSIKQQGITFTYKTRTWNIPATQARGFYKIISNNDGTYSLQLQPGTIYSYLNIHVSPVLNDTGEQSRFLKDSNGTIILIHGGRKGSIVDGIKTSLALRSALQRGKSNIAISMMPYRPAIFSADDFAKLQFPNLIATGTTSFAGSPNNRIHNIIVGTEKFNGVVIMPGEEFSFNKYLGAVDEANDYLPELVIKENVTTPEFGGGICQISTTAFRAAMLSGLEVTERHNHSYPVSYYGPPGFDATVYEPAPNFRFKNDMKTPVLLKTSVVGSKVFFEVWGTNDGRTVTINGPFVTEKKPDGSITAAIAQIVTKAGKTIREANFVSHYQPASKFPHVTAANGEKQ
ncbi:MAG TPA: VanW family protein [Candidatus Andersenbacteria bacterium]|nr:VanW family protein [Candidatus Andersenbacteria bacterium]